MERNKYYVSVQSRSIMSNQGDAAYELEIEATDEEIKQLQELFEVEEDFEIDTFLESACGRHSLSLRPGQRRIRYGLTRNLSKNSRSRDEGNERSN